MNGKEELIFTNNSIKLSTDPNDAAVMHSGERKLMEKLVEIATPNGGDILEIGFGLHLSADAIQRTPNIKSHTIIEIHPQIYKQALEWAKDKPNTKIILGDWKDVLPLENIKFDGVVHDTHLDCHIPAFLDYVKDNCKKGTIVAFFEYPVFDFRLNGFRFSMPEEDFNSLPYKEHIAFLNNIFELKYTRFDGNKFYSDNITNKLL